MADEKSEQLVMEWYELYGDAIFRHCYFRLKGDRERAKELVQETFVRAWKASRSQEIENVRAFLYRIATNLVIDEARQSRRTVISLDYMKDQWGFDVGIADESNAVVRHLEVEEIMRVLEQLSPEYREVIVMRYIDEMNPAEIAEVKGENANTISVRLNRAINALKKYLSYE